MEELTQKELENYLRDLPTSVLGLVQDKTWLKKITEIAQKYSLTEEQTTVLTNLVLFVIIGVEEPETFEKSVEQELGISKLLTEQIIKDVDERVFQYVFNLISENDSVSKSTFDNEENKASATTEEIPEVRPEISPMVEKGEIAHDNPASPMAPTQPIQPLQTSQQNKLVQPVENAKPTSQAPENLHGMEVAAQPQKYTVDPYREPIE